MKAGRTSKLTVCIALNRRTSIITSLRIIPRNTSTIRKTNSITILTKCISLICPKFKRASSLRIIPRNTSTIRKTNSITILTKCMSLIFRKFEIASSLRIIPCNTSTIRKTISITILTTWMSLICPKFEIPGHFSHIDMIPRFSSQEKRCSNLEHGICRSLLRSLVLHFLDRFATLQDSMDYMVWGRYEGPFSPRNVPDGFLVITLCPY
jgi:hypothetical protein